MPQRTRSSSIDQLFGALANPTRRDILDLLLDGDQTVQSIASRFDMSRPSVSEHLKALKDAGLVSEEKSGRFRHYSVNPQPLQEVQSWLNPYERFWRGRLDDLGSVLDELGQEKK